MDQNPYQSPESESQAKQPVSRKRRRHRQPPYDSLLMAFVVWGIVALMTISLVMFLAREVGSFFSSLFG
jgi:hypothetical protein